MNSEITITSPSGTGKTQLREAIIGLVKLFYGDKVVLGNDGVRGNSAYQQDFLAYDLIGNVKFSHQRAVAKMIGAISKVPADRLESFAKSVEALAKSHTEDVNPLYIVVNSGADVQVDETLEYIRSSISPGLMDAMGANGIARCNWPNLTARVKPESDNERRTATFVDSGTPVYSSFFIDAEKIKIGSTTTGNLEADFSDRNKPAVTRRTDDYKMRGVCNMGHA